MTADLVTWFRACLDDDEQVARDAIQPTAKPGPVRGVWTASAHPMGYVSADDFELFDEGTFTAQHAAHIARWDPARVLAEVSAKRKLLELHTIEVRQISGPTFDQITGVTIDPEWEVLCAVCGWASYDPTSACETVRLRVAPFASRAGFDPSWLD